MVPDADGPMGKHAGAGLGLYLRLGNWKHEGSVGDFAPCQDLLTVGVYFAPCPGLLWGFVVFTYWYV